jgi:hypothetical protein
MAKRLLPIEQLLHWAYAEQRVHLNVQGTPGRIRPLGDDGDLERGIGCLAVSGDHSHPDAMAVDRLISGLERSRAALVRKHGIAGTRPDWRPGARHRLEARYWEHGRSSRWAKSIKTLKARDPYLPHVLVNPLGEYDYCEVIEVDAPDDIANVRAIYRDWLVGLIGLRDALLLHGDSLEEHGVTDVLPPLAPWSQPFTQRILIAANTR